MNRWRKERGTETAAAGGDGAKGNSRGYNQVEFFRVLCGIQSAGKMREGTNIFLFKVSTTSLSGGSKLGD